MVLDRSRDHAEPAEWCSLEERHGGEVGLSVCCVFVDTVHYIADDIAALVMPLTRAGPLVRL